MYDLTVPHPKKLFNNIFSLFIADQVSGDETFELIIRLTETNLSVRNLAAYLNFIDKAYGRLTQKGIKHYSKTSTYELKITEIRRGSIELVIADIVSNTASIKALIIVGLLLQCLPKMIKSVLSSYRDYEEARLARIRRKQIKEQMKENKNLIELTDRQINQLVVILDMIYLIDKRNIPKAYNFSKENISQIKFNLQKPKKSLHIQEENNKKLKEGKIKNMGDI